MKIYISGKISGLTEYKQKFQKAADEIRRKGHEPVNPCDLSKILNPETTSWEAYMIACMGLLRCCQAIYLLPDWDRSRGTKLELREAKRLNFKVYQDLKKIPTSG